MNSLRWNGAEGEDTTSLYLSLIRAAKRFWENLDQKEGQFWSEKGWLLYIWLTVIGDAEIKILITIRLYTFFNKSLTSTLSKNFVDSIGSKFLNSVLTKRYTPIESIL